MKARNTIDLRMLNLKSLVAFQTASNNKYVIEEEGEEDEDEEEKECWQ